MSVKSLVDRYLETVEHFCGPKLDGNHIELRKKMREFTKHSAERNKVAELMQEIRQLQKLIERNQQNFAIPRINITDKK